MEYAVKIIDKVPGHSRTRVFKEIDTFHHCQVRDGLGIRLIILNGTVSEFNEFKPRFKSPKTGFHFAPKIEIEKLDTIFSGTKHI